MILNIYKPPGMTSHDVVDEVRRITGERKVGHAGTLDPFAEGVLVVAVGRESTKKLGEISKNTKKEYLATMELGKSSSTGDPTGEIRSTNHEIRNKLKAKNSNVQNKSLESQYLNFDIDFLRKSLKKFTGEIEQVPPKYSAIKINGKPAYRYAREGREVEISKRKVRIYEIELVEHKPPFLTIRVVCSSGTYIRTLAEDIGKKLGTGAYLTKLVRTKVGEYAEEQSLKLAELPENLSQNE